MTTKPNLFSQHISYFLINLGIIAILGLVFLYSSSYMYAKETFGNPYFLVGKQTLFLAIGCGFAWLISKTRFTFWYHNSLRVHLFITFLLFLTFIPAIGITIKGANRWINLGLFRIQPGEMLKYSTLLISTYIFENFKQFSRDTKIIYLAALFLPIGITILQPDFGTFAICIFLVFFIAFLSELPRIYFAICALLGGAGFITLLIAAPYRMKRLMSFLDPWADPHNSGFQIIQSYLAFAHGAIWGKGLGGSIEKLFYLPEAYNDFIFSVIGEELGFIGVLLISTLFLSLIFWGFKLALNCKPKAGKVFISGYIFLVSIQAFLNMAVVLGLVPTKGLNLPFISYGGSSLLSNLLALGLILSLKRYNIKSFSKNDFLFKENTHVQKFSSRLA